MTDGSLPRGWRRLLEWVLPKERRDDVLGDLEESLAQRRRSRGARVARMWLWKEGLALLLWWVIRRLDMGRMTMMTMARDLMQDLRFAVRSLRRRRGFAAMAIGVLGLGIGSTTTIMTLVAGTFRARPPQVPEPERLFTAYREFSPGRGGGSLSHPDYLYYRDGASPLADQAAFSGEQQLAYALAGAGADQLTARFVSANYFGVLGVPIVRGRAF